MYDEPVLDDIKLALGALRRVVDVLAAWGVLLEPRDTVERIAVAAIVVSWVYYGTATAIWDRMSITVWNAGACAIDPGNPSICIPIAE